MIKNARLAQLASAEIYQFFMLILGIVDRLNVGEQKIKLQRDAFAALLPRMQKALNREQAYELSKTLDELDARRDDAITGFALWIKSLTKINNTQIKASAIALRNYLKAQGNNIANQNLQKESATLSKIVNDCKNDETLKKHLEIVMDPGWLAEIDTANTLYITNFQKRSTEMSKDENEEIFSEVRKLAVLAYEDLMEIIESRYKVAKADNVDVTELKNCIDDCNTTIDQYKTLILQKKAKAKSTDSNEEKKG